MRQFLMSVAVLAALCTAVEARDGKNGNNGKSGNSGGAGNQQNHNQGNMQHLKPTVTSKDYHLTHATKYDFGYCFKGYEHRHWTHCCYFSQYGCNCNWCPCTCCWYYYCVPDCCWYPVTHCPYGKFVW
jgi:hypothetical protein